MQNGSIEVKLNGVPEILRSGEFILISPYTIHSFEVKRPSVAWVGVFSSDFVPTFAEREKGVRRSKFIAEDGVLKFLNEHLLFEGEPEYYTLTACLNLAVGECVKNAEAVENGECAHLLSRLPDYISEHISEPITMKDAARELGYEYHYFSAVFHKSFSMNFKSFLNIFRFDKACRLLANKSIDVCDISEKCGFGSQRSFNRVFKSLAGVTPSEYRSERK